MALSVRSRFEVFKRDDFTCQYCGRKSPDVVLEVDHIVPVAGGGTDDTINLRTSCWDCNRGKSDKPLDRVLTGEDPHDKAIEILERQRQLEEYNKVVADEREQRELATWRLVHYWKTEQGFTDTKELTTIGRQDYNWLHNALKWIPEQQVMQYMDIALAKDFTKNLKYVAVCCRNWRYEHVANQDTKTDESSY